jgi:hypothetical protein
MAENSNVTILLPSFETFQSLSRGYEWGVSSYPTFQSVTSSWFEFGRENMDEEPVRRTMHTPTEDGLVPVYRTYDFPAAVGQTWPRSDFMSVWAVVLLHKPYYVSYEGFIGWRQLFKVVATGSNLSRWYYYDMSEVDAPFELLRNV